MTTIVITNPELNAALRRIGFSDAAAVDIIDSQGIDSLEELKVLEDKDVESLCKVVRKIGSTSGLNISLRAETNMKLTCYCLKYQERTSRIPDPDLITLDGIRALRAFKQWELDHKDVTAPTIHLKDWSKTVQGLVEYLKGCLGVTKIPLAYVVREDLHVVSDPPGGYATRQLELIARAPIILSFGPPQTFTQTFLDDRAKVWELLSALTRDLECWSYVSPAQKSRDGRAAFFNLKMHYLGVNHVDNMAAMAEKKLQTNVYPGETRKWNFEKYVRVQVDQHVILNNLREHGYAGIDRRTMVRHLLAGIKTTALDHVKTRILSNAFLRENFSACVNLFQDFITQKESDPTSITIAAISQGQVHQDVVGGKPKGTGKMHGQKRGKPSGKAGSTNTTDRYYTSAE